MLSMEPLIRVENLAFRYADKVVFRNLDLMFPKGRFAGLVGPSGCGKSTFLKCILGILPGFEGRVLVAGEKVNGRAPKGIGYVPQLQTSDWNFPVTVEQVVMMGITQTMGFLPWPSRRDRRRVAELLESLGIGPHANRHIKALSGGELQRVFLARALVQGPDLLILDEPTAGVDLKNQHAILHLLGDLHRREVAILLTTHDLNAVARHLPWVICFNRGIVAQGPPEEVFTPEILSRTYDSEMSVVRRGEVTLVDDSPNTAFAFKKWQHLHDEMAETRWVSEQDRSRFSIDGV